MNIYIHIHKHTQGRSQNFFENVDLGTSIFPDGMPVMQCRWDYILVMPKYIFFRVSMRHTNKQSFHLSIKFCANFAFGCFEPTEGDDFAVFGTKLTFSLDGRAAIRQDG